MRIGDFVQKLLGRRGARDAPAGVRDLAERRVAVGVDVGEREAQVRHVGNLLAAGVREVTAAELPRAFEQMTDGGAARESIDVVQGPAELVHQRCHEQRRIGDATREDDVGATRERGQHGFRAKVCIGRHDGTERRQRHARLQRGRRRSSASSTSSPVTAATLMGSFSRRAMSTTASAAASGFAAPKLLTSLTRLRTSVGSSDSTRSCKSRVVAAGRIAPAAQLGQRDRALGKALEDQIVELAALGKIHGRIETIAREAGAAAESHSLHRPLLIRARCPPS